MRSENSTTPSCFADPFDGESSLVPTCACGCGGPAGTHPAQTRKTFHSKDREGLLSRLVESSVTRALFSGHEPSRRAFMRAMGAGAAMALVGSVFPLEAAKALAAEKIGPLEKKDAKIGFIFSLTNERI